MAMRIAPAAVLLLLAHAATGAATTLDDLPARTTYTLHAIEVKGADDVSASTIEGAMLTELPPWWKPWKRWRKTPFNADVFRTDLDRVKMALRAAGHFEATVDYDLQVHGDAVTVVLRVHEGPAARVEKVDLVAHDFTLADEERAALRALVPFSPGDTFTHDPYAKAQGQIETYYRNHGFAYVVVERHAVVDTGSDLVDLTYTIDRGPPAVFGTTHVTGTQTVPDRLVRREITYQEDAPFDPRQLDETQARVFGLKLFRSVTVKPTNLDARSGVVDVGIDVTEGPPRELEVGVGYGLEDGPRGQLRWQHNDFLGGGRQLGFRLKGSLIEQAFESEFRQPFFLAPRQTLIVPLVAGAGGRARVHARPRALRPAHRAEDRRRPPDRARLRRRVRRPEQRAERDRAAARGVPRPRRGLEHHRARRAQHHHRPPRSARGERPHLPGRAGGRPLAGGFQLLPDDARGEGYWPVLGTRVIAARVLIGGADAYGQSRDVPLFRRFFAGGINSTRGYARWKLGPLNDTHDHDPVGGRSLLEGAVELRTPIWHDLGGVVFLDVGEVRRQAFSYTTGDLQFGAGVGVRYHTIVGPLRLDLGFPFQPPPGEASWQVHFSIGQAF